MPSYLSIFCLRFIAVVAMSFFTLSAGGVLAVEGIDQEQEALEVLAELKAVVVVARPEDVKMTGRPGWQGVV
ncbi:MAG: hypothetical protein GXP30_04070, partial [Verrucomicrobia bacterium]|nr:hypothetical protein [Verrucomicrobiota bacterium]